MADRTSPGILHLERALRELRRLETENARLKAQRDLDKSEIAILRDQKEGLARDLATERSGRLERDQELTDWLGQGRELLAADVAAERAAPAQSAREAIRADLRAALDGAKERFGQIDFDRTFGGADSP